MVISTAQHWEDQEQLKANIPREERIGHILWLLGGIFAVLGIIGDAANLILGLEPMSWFLLAVAAYVASIAPFIEWGLAWYLKTRNLKQPKNEG